MLESEQVLRYLCDVGHFGGLDDAPNPSIHTHWTVSFEELRAGGLSSHLTREILLTYSHVNEDCAFGEREVPVACCIRSLKGVDGTYEPVLFVTGLVDATGTVHADSNTHTWIPKAHVARSEFYNGSIALCDIDAYHAHALAMSSLPVGKTWSDAIDRSIDFFSAVCSLDEEALTAHNLSWEESECLLFLWEAPAEQIAISTVLKNASEHASAYSGPLLSALNSDTPEQSNTTEDLPDDVLLPHKLTCGIPDGLPPLTDNEHAVLARVAQQGSEQSFCLSAPKGTHATAFALAAMTNHYTDCALRGDKAPSMLCVGTKDQLKELVDILARRPAKGQTDLASRWLPRVAFMQHGGSGSSRDRRVLGALQALCRLHTTSATDPDLSHLCLSQPFAHPGGGDVAFYLDEWYLPKASIHYLDCASGFAKERFRTLAEARQRLAETLRRIDQDRCELVDAYADVCKADELLKQRDDLVARIGHLRRGHTLCKKRLEDWEELLRTNPPRKLPFTKAEPDQTALIRRHARPREELAQGKTLIADVCGAYRDEVARIENSIDRLRSASTNLTKRIQASEPAGVRCSQIIARLSAACKLTAEQTSLLETSIDGRAREISMKTLDEVLDRTVRPAEFWLAVHIYESSWIEINQQRTAKRSLSEAPSLAPEAFSTLCPFELVLADTAVGTIAESFGNAKTRINLAVCIGAHELDTTTGIAIASFCDRMLVIGTSGQLRSAALRNQMFDELRSSAILGEDAWEELVNDRMAVSSGYSFFDIMRASNHMPQAELTDTWNSYGELDDLRSDLVPEEPLHTSRTPANSTDDRAFALQGILASLSYVVVPDSSWEQTAAGRINRAEAMALVRWLSNHGNEILTRYDSSANRALICIVAPYNEQVDFIRGLLSNLDESLRKVIDVRQACHVGSQTWPLAIFCATCGPDTFASSSPNTLSVLLSTATASCTDALLVFFGSTWLRSSNPTAQAYLSRATQVGRLFSKPRQNKRKAQRKEKGQEPHAQSTVEAKVKPLALTSLLKRLYERGDIKSIPPASKVNAALYREGLIERVTEESKHMGWKPTPAGKEIGIVPTKDHTGRPFCAYTPSAEPVVARLADSV